MYTPSWKTSGFTIDRLQLYYTDTGAPLHSTGVYGGFTSGSSVDNVLAWDSSASNTIVGTVGTAGTSFTHAYRVYTGSGAITPVDDFYINVTLRPSTTALMELLPIIALLPEEEELAPPPDDGDGGE